MIKTDNQAQKAHLQDVADDAEDKRLQALYDERERAVDSLAKAFEAAIFDDELPVTSVAEFAPTVNDYTKPSVVGFGGRRWPQRKPFIWECLSEGLDSLSGAEQAKVWQAITNAVSGNPACLQCQDAILAVVRAFAEAKTPEVQE